jgi:hypothetical protein
LLVEKIGLTRQQRPTFILWPQRLSHEHLHYSGTTVLFGLRPGTLGFSLTFFSLTTCTRLRLCRMFSLCSRPLGFLPCLSSVLPLPHSPKSQTYGNTQADQRQRQLPTDLA